jgi:hypothetical protein
LANCADALELIFLAAAKAGGEKDRNRLPGVLDSFVGNRGGAGMGAGPEHETGARGGEGGGAAEGGWGGRRHRLKKDKAPRRLAEQILNNPE